MSMSGFVNNTRDNQKSSNDDLLRKINANAYTLCRVYMDILTLCLQYHRHLQMDRVGDGGYLRSTES